MIKHLFLIWGLLAALTAEPVLACTSAVVSGKVTPDGRPLLWKNRDTDYLRNHVAYIKGEKYNFIADVNSANFPALKEAWMGTNSVGFALMNTQSYNLVEVKDGEERGAGYVRYMEADRVLMRASATGGITPQGIFNDLSRSFRNGMLDIDLKNGKFNRPQGSGWFVDQDFIPRNSTSCSIVVQGVKPGEKVELTTMWTMLGYPPTGIAVPLWVKDADRLLPPMVCWDKACAAAPLSDWSLRLSNNVFCYNQGMGTNRYLNWEKLYNMENNGYMQQLVTVEAEVFRRTCLLLDSWRQQGSIDSQEMQKLYQDVEALVRKAYTPLMEQ